MIQDIGPSKLDNTFIPYEIREGDCLLVFDEQGRILIRQDSMAENGFPTKKEVGNPSNPVYLFSLDDRRFFLNLCSAPDRLEGGFTRRTVRELRDILDGGKELFAAFTAYHLWRWYADNRYCGRCGAALQVDAKERAMRCPTCGNVIYPRINPAVIVGVMKGEKLLITRYRQGYKHNALVAGFTEIGETLEETVMREVREETGVKVKNIRYYKSQPWGMAQDILVGFFCEADGDGEIHMDGNELKYAEWVSREDIELQPNSVSLTNEMMRIFKEGKMKGYE